MNNLGNIDTIGNAWITMLREIIKNGKRTLYNGDVSKTIQELVGTTFTIKNIIMPDPIIEKYMVKEEYEWMEDNFTKLGTVKELHNENSYASRLYNYMNEKNQINWVIDRLKNKKYTCSATITTFEPLTDEKYIPCVSMIDFYVQNEKLDMYVYCRSLDFGCKAYVNLVMLYKILQQVSKEINLTPGDMHMTIKSSHIYDKDRNKIDNIFSNLSK
jgi:thymidylate synthase